MSFSSKSIAVLLSRLTRGGAETQSVHLVRALARKGWRCRILSLKTPDAFVDEMAEAGIPVVCLNMKGVAGWPAAALRLRRELRRHPSDVLLALTIHANVLAKVVGHGAGVPVVVSSIRSEQFGGVWGDRIERWTGRGADRTVVNSRHVGEALQRRGVLRAGGWQVIGNALSHPAPDGADGERRVRGRNWLNVGRLVPAKAHTDLLEAFSRVLRKFPDARLTIAGGGALRAEIEQAAGRLELGDSLRLLGERSDIPELLAVADHFVLSSRWEGMPNVVMEAMAAGVPVVTTDVGGVRELTGDGSLARVVPPADPSALAAAMEDAMREDGDALETRVAAARARILEHHDPATVTDRWLELFEQLYASKGGKAGAG